MLRLGASVVIAASCFSTLVFCSFNRCRGLGSKVIEFQILLFSCGLFNELRSYRTSIETRPVE